MSLILLRPVVLATICGTIVVAAAAAADGPAGGASAEQQLRVARRLAAEGSPDAGAAFARVVADHAGDPLADDALVEHAVWLGAPAWPEELAAFEDERAGAVFDLLRRAAGAAGDRRPEALYRLAIVDLASGLGAEPGAPLSLARLRPSLLEVATAPGPGPWPGAARYTIAWIDETAGDLDRARAAYHRLAIDDPGSDAGRRAAVGLGRILLRRDTPGLAAARLQEAIDGGAPVGLGAADLRELAVRGLLRGKTAAASWTGRAPEGWASGARGAVAIARAPGGGTLIADRRGRAVLLFDAGGAPAGRWDLDSVQALAIDPFGRIYAAAGGAIVRLATRGTVAAVAPQGDFAPASGLAADGTGRVYLLDKRGDRVGVVQSGAAGPTVVRARRGAGFAGIACDGSRLLVGEGKTGRVVEVGDDGSERTIVDSGATSVTALAVDAAGAIAVVDARADTVLLFGPAGDVRDRFGYEAVGFARVTGVAFGRRGDLELLEGATGNVVRLP